MLNFDWLWISVTSVLKKHDWVYRIEKNMNDFPGDDDVHVILQQNTYIGIFLHTLG